MATIDEVTAFVSNRRFFALGESLGGVKSLICHPARMTHASIPADRRAALGLSDTLIRLSPGIEHADDLIDDLRRRFACCWRRRARAHATARSVLSCCRGEWRSISSPARRDSSAVRSSSSSLAAATRSWRSSDRLSKSAMLKALGVEIHPGDITERDTLKAPMTGVDGVFHVAAWYKVGVKEPLADQINVDGTRNVLQTMRTLENRARGLHQHRRGVFRYQRRGPRRDLPLRRPTPERVRPDEMDRALPRGAAEDRGGPAAVDRDAGSCLRPRRQRRDAYGPGRPAARPSADDAGEDRVLLGPRRGHRPRPHPGDGAGQARRDLHHRRAHATPSSTPSILPRRSRKVRAPVFHPGPHAMRAMAAAMSVVGRLVTLPPALMPEALRVLAGTTYFGSNEKAMRELGFSPRPLEEGMAQTLEHELRLLGRA